MIKLCISHFLDRRTIAAKMFLDPLSHVKDKLNVFLCFINLSTQLNDDMFHINVLKYHSMNIKCYTCHYLIW